MSQTEVAEHMQTVKYPAARAVIGLLKDAGLRALHVGSLAFDPCWTCCSGTPTCRPSARPWDPPAIVSSSTTPTP